jgi:predicted O-linked N-acetylglucosamine transferase (SPINDLY family)
LIALPRTHSPTGHESPRILAAIAMAEPFGELQLQHSVGSRAFQNTRLQKQARKQAEALLSAAIKAYGERRHGDVQALCRQILKHLPNHFDALHLLGVSASDCGRFDEAALILVRAIAIEPRSAEAHSNLGQSLFKLKRYEEARAAYEKALALKPSFAMALTNLGNTLLHLRLLDQSIAAHDRAIALKPDYSDAYSNRGMALMLVDRNEEAACDFERALSLNPRLLPAMIGKGMVNIRLRNYDLALATLNAALAAKPDAAAALAQRGRLFQEIGQFDQAAAEFDAALKLEPWLEPALCGKANTALHRGFTAEAIAACNKTLEQNPNSEVALTVLGACYAKQGEPASAIAYFDRALALKPDYQDAILRKIFALDFLSDTDFVRLQEPRNFWWREIGAKLPRRQLGECNLDPERRLVVGYVSSDFRNHSAALAFMPLLHHRDRGNFEIIGYSSYPTSDATTEQCRLLADQWVDASQLNDDRLADRIQADKVDILVDLSGHSAGNRLSMFARKPAPIQVSAIGHVTGTGMPVMDYLLADATVIPADVRPMFAEKVYDLPCCITIGPPPNVPASSLPMIRNGYVTFGVFNRIDKISDPALALWFRLMQAVPSARIVVKHGAIDDPMLRDALIARFVAHGIDAERLRFIGSTSRLEHLDMFAEIDMSLDPFPQNGGISTWESLQMGVPVITRLGNSAASRIGGAIVRAVGLDDWIADDDEGYVAIARKFAMGPDALAAIRAALPAMVANSEAGDCERYTRLVEEGYRRFWRDYCAAASR